MPEDTASVEVVIGGNTVKVPVPYNFRRIKLAWPHVNKAANATENPLEAMDAMLAIIAIGVITPVHGSLPNSVEETAKLIVDKIADFEEEVTGPEAFKLQDRVFEVMSKSGLIRQKADGTIVGNAAPEGENPAPSTETGTLSSPSLSPPTVAGVTGSE